MHREDRKRGGTAIALVSGVPLGEAPPSKSRIYPMPSGNRVPVGLAARAAGRWRGVACHPKPWRRVASPRGFEPLFAP